jgi:hypothetical protein
VTHERVDDVVKPALDTLSLGTVVATLVGYLPSIAALVSIIWGCIRIYETDTVRRILGRKQGG